MVRVMEPVTLERSRSPASSFQEVSTPAVIFREDSLETWLFISGFGECRSKDFDVESEAKEMTT